MKTFQPAKTYAVFANPANRKLIEELENNGSKVFQFAPLETVKIEAGKNPETIENSLAECNWIIFHDVFSVEYFLEILEKKAIDLFELDEIRVVACGEAVADKLRFVQLHADIITASDETSDVFARVLSYVGETEMAETIFLIPKEIAYSSALTEKLIKTGAKAAEMPVYQILINDKKEYTKLKTLLKGGAIDEFIFTSPEDVFYIKNYFSLEALPELFSDTKVSGTNEITVHSLNEIKLGAKRFYNIKRG